MLIINAGKSICCAGKLKKQNNKQMICSNSWAIFWKDLIAELDIIYSLTVSLFGVAEWIDLFVLIQMQSDNQMILGTNWI